MAAKKADSVATAMARTPASFAIFDVLWLDEDLTRLVYRDRRALLESLNLLGHAWCTVSTFVGAGAEVFAACSELGLEGLVAKRLDSRYESGVRSKRWVKAKCVQWFEHHAQYRH